MSVRATALVAVTVFVVVLTFAGVTTPTASIVLIVCTLAYFT